MTLRRAYVAIPVGLVVAATAMAPVATNARTVHRTSKHHRRHHARIRTAVLTSTVNCSGTQSTNVPYDLNVPAGKTCTVKKGVAVGHDIIVNTGSTLIDQGANVASDIQATSPKGIGVGGGGSVGHDIQITGTSGAGPGTVHAGDNYVCSTQIAHDLSVLNSTSKAGQWIIGDIDEECTAGGNLIGDNLNAQGNQNRVDISDNKQGQPPYAGGIGNNLNLSGNKVTSTSPIVESNYIGDEANCQAGTKMDGDGTHNVVGVQNNGCP